MRVIDFRKWGVPKIVCADSWGIDLSEVDTLKIELVTPISKSTMIFKSKEELNDFLGSFTRVAETVK